MVTSFRFLVLIKESYNYAIMVHKNLLNLHSNACGVRNTYWKFYFDREVVYKFGHNFITLNYLKAIQYDA